MNLAILGTGNMGRAIIGGLKRAYGGDVRIVAWDKAAGALDGLGDGVEVVSPPDWKSAKFTPDVLIVSVKPPDVPGLLSDIVVPLVRGRGLDFLTVSVAAGVSIQSIRASLGNTARVCRVMPNTPALIGEGVSAYSLSDTCRPDDAGLVEYVFSACGKVVSVYEGLMDAVTGLSGSGPAFAYSFIEALAEGGVGAGLPYKLAMEMAVQTVVGAARMVQATAEHPSVLRSRVMSPGGTTVKGLEALERAAFKSTVMSAVAEAAAQSARMAGKN
ncbi:MAG: pyrroline-5-carboxylate reductase [Chitinispirillales bacterium]|jgi:pyrroline-5-carboxylate reductase|nr:pyrroline-5-carboxylate reductase [Chitinispirillales bacterium]